MAGIGGSSSATTYGTNQSPVSFPGIVSGIDYNAIINKLTALTIAPQKQYQTQVTNLTAKNAEFAKIGSLLSTVQSAIGALSDPNLFNAYNGASSDTTSLTAKGIPGVSAVPGSYIINATTLATSTAILGSTSAAIAHTLADVIAGNSNPAYNGLPAKDVPLAQAYTSITPVNSTNGSSQGQITVDGIAVKYDVASQSLDSILSNIQSAVTAAYSTTPGFQFSIAYDTTKGDANFDGVIVTSNQSISIGSANDSGNLQQVLKLDTATVNNGVPQSITANGSTAVYANSVVSNGGVGGVSLGGPLNGPYHANFLTPITSGTITINGVKIAIDATGDNVSSILKKINGSSAGVVAQLDTASGRFTLTSKATGSQGIVVGGTAYGDTSNFLDAAGLTVQSGSVTSVGKQASVSVTDPSGNTKTYVANANAVKTAIPGIELDLVSNTTKPFTVSVTQDSTQAISAVNQFVSAYNAAINELNQATSAPVITSSTAAQSQSTSTTGSSQTLSTGGVLFGDSTADGLKNTLVNLATGIFSGNQTYRTFSSIGLSLDSSFTQLTAAASTPGTTGSVTQKTVQGTSGAFALLNTTAFTSALFANPSEITTLFTSSQGLIGKLGAYLTGVTGAPTILNSGLVGTVPQTALLQSSENANTAQISSTQAFIKLLTDRANAQADQLRAEFTTSETLTAQYQNDQATLKSAGLN